MFDDENGNGDTSDDVGDAGAGGGESPCEPTPGEDLPVLDEPSVGGEGDSNG